MSDFLNAVSSTNKACITNGVNTVAVGTGLADATLGAPSPGHECTIIVKTRTSGNGVVTTATGVTFDGTNNTATFDAVNESLTLVYKDAVTWEVKANIGAVAMSSV
jgi:hypothetical protein